MKKSSNQGGDPEQCARAKAVSTRDRRTEWNGLGCCPRTRAEVRGDTIQCRLSETTLGREVVGVGEWSSAMCGNSETEWGLQV